MGGASKCVHQRFRNRANLDVLRRSCRSHHPADHPPRAEISRLINLSSVTSRSKGRLFQTLGTTFLPLYATDAPFRTIVPRRIGDPPTILTHDEAPECIARTAFAETELGFHGQPRCQRWAVDTRPAGPNQQTRRQTCHTAIRAHVNTVTIGPVIESELRQVPNTILAD
jgi:hypothetical protein